MIFIHYSFQLRQFSQFSLDNKIPLINEIITIKGKYNHSRDENL